MPLSALSPAVAERVTPLNARPADPSGAYVLYWMRTASRGHENPALDAAIEAANTLGVPAFVYHALSERYPYANDRLHTFILEGARDAAREMRARGVGTAFHLARPDHRGPHLSTLAQGAALVVTEDMPVTPLAELTRRLADRVCCAMWAVDTACVAPMARVRGRHDRAFRFRQAAQPLWDARVTAAWREAVPEAAPTLPPLPFTPVDLDAADIAALVASCDINHAVAPVPHTPGGGVAGYARWGAFRDQALGRYRARRNDPLAPAGGSRLSAYLHFGQVSPLRIAREAADRGAAKFLDELLTWRELAYHYCRHTPEHASFEVLPDWARESLRAAAADRRPAALDAEALARGRTGDALWDACQRSLLVHGELHNNVRMTWGKALLSWTDDPEIALKRALDLNHRYALDGRDPASYAGVLWCFGGLDRPFDPPQPILGRVRPRPLSHHAQRLDVARYTAHVDRPRAGVPATVAVVGAGLSGAMCARTLADHGLTVSVFDKGRGPGGRASTRGRDGSGFDHGAQYFTARDPSFRRYVAAWTERGHVARWQGRLGRWTDGAWEPLSGDRFVGVPGMSAVVAHLTADLGVRFGTRVVRAERDAGGTWALWDDAGAGLGRFDHLVVALPGPQAAPLLATPAPALSAAAAAIGVAPCWAAMMTFGAPLSLPFDGARIGGGDGPIAWLAREGSKPGRVPGERWTVHAGPKWSQAHLEDASDDVARALADVLGQTLGVAQAPVSVVAHRWRYALVTRPLGVDAVYDPELRVGLCGDGVRGERVESAFLSGAALAGRLLAEQGKGAALERVSSPAQARLAL